MSNIWSSPAVVQEQAEQVASAQVVVVLVDIGVELSQLFCLQQITQSQLVKVAHQ
jgi:hypothetical protein